MEHIYRVREEEHQRNVRFLKSELILRTTQVMYATIVLAVVVAAITGFLVWVLVAKVVDAGILILIVFSTWVTYELYREFLILRGCIARYKK